MPTATVKSRFPSSHFRYSMIVMKETFKPVLWKSSEFSWPTQLGFCFKAFRQWTAIFHLKPFQALKKERTVNVEEILFNKRCLEFPQDKGKSGGNVGLRKSCEIWAEYKIYFDFFFFSLLAFVNYSRIISDNSLARMELWMSVHFRRLLFHSFTHC